MLQYKNYNPTFIFIVCHWALCSEGHALFVFLRIRLLLYVHQGRESKFCHVAPDLSSVSKA